MNFMCGFRRKCKFFTETEFILAARYALDDDDVRIGDDNEITFKTLGYIYESSEVCEALSLCYGVKVFAINKVCNALMPYSGDTSYFVVVYEE